MQPIEAEKPEHVLCSFEKNRIIQNEVYYIIPIKLNSFTINLLMAFPHKLGYRVLFEFFKYLILHISILVIVCPTAITGVSNIKYNVPCFLIFQSHSLYKILYV